jgi:hypothetical protein
VLNQKQFHATQEGTVLGEMVHFFGGRSFLVAVVDIFGQSLCSRPENLPINVFFLVDRT